MNTLLKTITVLGLTTVVFAGFANSASANNCVSVAGKFYLDGELVEKAKCSGKTKTMKEITKAAGTYTDKCEGKPKGFTYLDIGPDGKRLARFTCRGS